VKRSEVKALLILLSLLRSHAQGEGAIFKWLWFTSDLEGLSSVKRQQLVYSHASRGYCSWCNSRVTMKTYTPEQKYAIKSDYKRLIIWISLLITGGTRLNVVVSCFWREKCCIANF